MNLAGNAVKFTEKGSVVLTIDRVVATASEGVTASHPLTTPGLLFSVADTGIGIPPEKLTAVFDSFQQVHSPSFRRGRGEAGTGLGLTIARELVQLHGSDIQVQSTPGQGSTFSFTLALPLADPADLEAETARGDELYFANPIRILLADDNALNREIATAAIRRHFENAEIAEAATGREAVNHLSAMSFDVALMDMQMPEMTGTEATRHIREQLKSDVPIIALTASATPEEVELALASGMDRHLGKPFKSYELARVVAEVLGLEVGRRSATTDLPGFENLEGLKNRDYDLRFLHDFCDGDEAQMRHFLQKFEEQYPQELKKLETAIRLEDREAVCRTAHSFRPQLEFVGLKEAANVVLQIEQNVRGGEAIQSIAVSLRELELMLKK